MANAQALVERAQRCMDMFELSLALKFYERALEHEPDNCEILDAAGELLMRLGETERALALLQKSVSLVAEGNFATHMHLGQLQSGATAVQSFEQGLNLLRKREATLRKRSTKGAAGARAREELTQVEQHTCAALCAIAEVRAAHSPMPLARARASSSRGQSTDPCGEWLARPLARARARALRSVQRPPCPRVLTAQRSPIPSRPARASARRST
jgi:tetratricopeptide (TPR) repeat protein